MINLSMFIAVVVIALIALIGALVEHERYCRARDERNEIRRSVSRIETERDQALSLMRKALHGGPHTHP